MTALWSAISSPACLIGGSVTVEIKAVSALTQAHEVQLVNYLTATGIEIGLLLNFGAAGLQIRRKYRTYRGREASDRNRLDKQLKIL